MAKLHATETANEVCYTAIQLTGGIGLYQGDTTRTVRPRCQSDIHLEGTSEVQRIIIARELLAEVSIAQDETTMVQKESLDVTEQRQLFTGQPQYENFARM